MKRFLALEKEINKNTFVRERDGEQIAGWSPNNVRKLIISANWAVVEYFLTGGKYPRSFVQVDLRSALNSDLELLRTDQTKYIPILNVLTSGRILSSVEEIIFSTEGYPSALLNIDTNHSKLQVGNVNLENRFVRLRHITLANTGIETLSKLAVDAKKTNSLILDILLEESVSHQILIEPHKDDWWKGQALRPKYYLMDKTSLAKYFDDVKAKKQVEEKENKLRELDLGKQKELVAENERQFGAILTQIYDLFEKAHGVFSRASVPSKAEWASFLEYKNICRGIRLELQKSEERVISYRKINFDKLIEVFRTCQADEDTVRSIMRFRDTVFKDILQNEEEYKRESNKSNLTESIQTLKNLIAKVLELLTNMVFSAFVHFLTRNSESYILFYFEQTNISSTQIEYTRPMVEFVNTYGKHGQAKISMDKIGAREVLVDQFPVTSRLSTVKAVLEGLENSTRG